MRRTLALSLLATGALMVLFLSVLLREEPTLLRPLIDTTLVREPRRAAARIADGRILTGTITADLELTASEPVILRGEVRIPAGVTVRTLPGTEVVSDEDAHLTVAGVLESTDTSWTANALFEEKRRWHGITAATGGTVTLRKGELADATAAVTCAPGGRVVVDDSTFTHNTVGVVSLPDGDCRVSNTTVSQGTVGVLSVGGSPELSDVTLTRLTDGLRVFHGATPRLSTLRLSRISRHAVLYRATGDLTIQRLAWENSRPLADAIHDGADAPTHRWRSAEYPTGRVTIEKVVGGRE